jgi:hypothetical protein
MAQSPQNAEACIFFEEKVQDFTKSKEVCS